jgi:hypothetical protein
VQGTGSVTPDGPHPSLDALGRLHGTDKASGGHNYLTAYEPFFAPLRDGEITLLEIGVKQGASLRVWRDYFPKARIIGVDIAPLARDHAEDRIAIEIADQGRRPSLMDIAKRHGPFDIIIEDGSHLWQHQILAIMTLVPQLKPGGLFVSEDLQVSFPPLARHYARGAERSAFDMLRDLAELVLRSGRRASPEADDLPLRRLAHLLSWVLFVRHACIMRRRD